MKEIRRITITTTRRLRVIASTMRADCPVCAREVATISTREAAAALEIEGLMLDELIAGGRIHSINMVGGDLRVCQESLFE